MWSSTSSSRIYIRNSGINSLSTPWLPYDDAEKFSALHISLIPTKTIVDSGQHQHIWHGGIQNNARTGPTNVSTWSDGSVKDGVRGYTLCISDSSFTHNILGHAQTVGHKKDMISLRVGHGGALGILLLVYVICMFYSHEQLHAELTVCINNSEVVMRGQRRVTSLGSKQ